jgi:hypothetical protein
VKRFLYEASSGFFIYTLTVRPVADKVTLTEEILAREFLLSSYVVEINGKCKSAV